MCIVGLDKHWIEKDVIKFFRKSFAQKSAGDGAAAATEQNAEENESKADIPLSGVAKKRGKTFGFLQFSSLAEKTDFQELFSMTVAPVKRFRLRDVNKLDATKGFRPVKDKVEMAQDSMRRKEEMHASVTQADVEEVLKETIEQRVTPYAQFGYPE